MITKRTVVGKIEVLEDGVIYVRTDTVIEEDGKELTRTFHRQTLEPGQNTSTHDARVQTLADAAWTQAVKDDFATKKAATLAEYELSRNIKVTGDL